MIELPRKQGLYDPANEKDSCGIGFIAHVKGVPSHSIIRQALQILGNLSHRGAQGSDPQTGDGAGILLQLPHELYSGECRGCGFELPEPGDYGVGMIFLPSNGALRRQMESLIDRTIRDEGLEPLGWRNVPVRSEVLGTLARQSEPVIRQIFIRRQGVDRGIAFERKLFVARKRIENLLLQSPWKRAGARTFIPSFSSRTVVYKGLMLPGQLGGYYEDLRKPECASALAVIHSRFSTNTFPSWRLAHPFRYLCHNGEINTIRGNLNWMKTREARMTSGLFGDDLKKLLPLIPEGLSDSACLDMALEFLVMGGRTIPHAMMMLIPEPWAGHPGISEQRRAFYEYHSALMEPWDGPAAVCFTDGIQIGATLDRNGLRPCRYVVTTEDTVILASEAGVLPLPPEKILRKGRLEPGKMFLVNPVEGKVLTDDEIKESLATRQPYAQWVQAHRVRIEDAEKPEKEIRSNATAQHLLAQQKLFGYTTEEIRTVLVPMAQNGEEAVSSMGNDTPLAVLSERPQLLFNYFKQLFAQVTNPPIDSIREQLVMSLTATAGPLPSLLEEHPEAWKRLEFPHPILTEASLARLTDLKRDPCFRSTRIPIQFNAQEGSEGLRKGIIELCRQASRAIAAGCRYLILTDLNCDDRKAPIPSLLATAAVHHHLLRKGLRGEVALLVETGEARDVHHFACLIGYGASAIHPYLAFQTLHDLERQGLLPAGIDSSIASQKFIKAINKGLLKIFSKMGISTLQSYCGAQIFEAIGLSSSLVERYFCGTASRIEGIDLKEIGEETLRRHRAAFECRADAVITPLDAGGDVHYRAGGEHHNWNPETIATLQHATRSGNPSTFAEFSRLVNDESRRHSTLRGLLDFNFAPTPIPLSEVQPATEIVKRFTTGAMSFGALGKEAHETLAIAMNRIGGKSNSGEGGEDAERATPLPNGDSRNSAIKQIASARFGVTAHYLVSARELQIKMAQGAKPGEGGQLPGHKVDDTIARLRFSTPGVQLISPPPHHDIYSIEDLKQLIFDLKNANPEAAVSVKLVSEVGVGTVAAGVAKAKADKILISGDSGGTGASPLSSIKYAGIPWELGLAETQQTLVLNGLRGRVRIETDGQLKTGRDVVIAALLGAEEFGFSTAPLIVEGCIMMRKCHLNTCPVGIATQDPELRKRFNGQPEHVINYFFFIAEEVRELMSRLGFRQFEDLVGRVEHLSFTRARDHWKAHGVDLSSLLRPVAGPDNALHCCESQSHGLDEVLDRELIRHARPAIEAGEGVDIHAAIQNTDRTTGTMLSSEIARRYGATGLADDTIRIHLRGSAGQSFGAFLSPGITLRLEGESNDYLGKGLSGGRIIVVPPSGSLFEAEKTIIIGNVALYGATRGETFIRGLAGERFAVRNSGAVAVVEGMGDHGCEYMTGGRVIVLGPTGRNFAAGMSGGIAYVYDEEGSFPSRCNRTMVELETVDLVEDEPFLRRMIESHYRLTGSRNAGHLLAHWENTLKRITKVMPTDYKRALAERQAAEALLLQNQQREAVIHG